MNHGLKPHHVSQIREIIKQNCKQIESVGLFGSRATGNYKYNSDIDLVIYGEVSDQECDRMYTCFLESLLPYKVDITVYKLVNFLPLKRHIDNVVQTLLTQEKLYEKY